MSTTTSLPSSSERCSSFAPSKLRKKIRCCWRGGTTALPVSPRFSIVSACSSC
ncbi:hypothetical protein C2845_PM09G16540 [Panicum miliaceum]|uniref:Uncharacterized protein n=1 Tax=Panicum miliaceum TaxID=4540 RepID=A0A3L6RWE1_PANMI|nr:hypothetical protein C2845_PM09G16540 [Panicum miliaceum]